MGKPQAVPICCECLGTVGANPSGEEEHLVSCWGCGQSVHPSCRVYSNELTAYFEENGWTCDDCKPCIVCQLSPSEREKSEHLMICEYCDQGVHLSCLHPVPDKRPKVWNCDDCRLARGLLPNGNIRKAKQELPDVVKKTASKSFFANRSVLGYEDDEDFECVSGGSLYPPPLSPQQPLHHGKNTEVIHIVTEDESADTISGAGSPAPPPLAYIQNTIPELVMEEEPSNLQLVPVDNKVTEDLPSPPTTRRSSPMRKLTTPASPIQVSGAVKEPIILPPLSPKKNLLALSPRKSPRPERKSSPERKVVIPEIAKEPIVENQEEETLQHNDSETNDKTKKRAIKPEDAIDQQQK